MSETPDSRKYSSKEIHCLLDELPTKLEELLAECTSKPPYFVPDYSKFDQAVNELLRPFFLFADEIFHATGELAEAQVSAMDVFSARKATYEAQLQQLTKSGNLDIGEKAIDACSRFKLLFHFFGYAEQSYPGNMAQLFDIDYQLRNEKDPKRKRELLDSGSKILEGTSSGLYARALQAEEKGDYNSALQLCEQAIQKFPGNTPVYKLKAKILQRMAAETIENGLKEEPRDKALRIEKQMWRLREQCAKGIIDADTLVTNLEYLVEKKYLQGKLAEI